MPTFAPALKQGTAGQMTRVVRSRKELLQQIRSVVHHVAPRWGDGGSATIVIASPHLGREDIEAAFFEIDEKYHLDGIDLRVHGQKGKHLRAVLESSFRGSR